jgi:hypothetical protein
VEDASLAKSHRGFEPVLTPLGDEALISNHNIAPFLTGNCRGSRNNFGQNHPIWQEVTMGRGWNEPKLDDLMADPILDVLLARDGVTRDDLHQVVERAREDLARVPREWAVDPQTQRAANDDFAEVRDSKK